MDIQSYWYYSRSIYLAGNKSAQFYTDIFLSPATSYPSVKDTPDTFHMQSMFSRTALWELLMKEGYPYYLELHQNC